MATALLISGQVKAVNVAQVGDQQFPSVYAAIQYINTNNINPATIDMLEASTETQILYFDGGKTFTWNFNGKTVTVDGSAGNKANIHVDHATLNLNGTGTLKFTPASGNYYFIQVHGSATEGDANYTVINVDGDLNIDGGDSYAFDVIYRSTSNGAKTTDSGLAYYSAYGVVINFKDCYISGNYAAITVNGTINRTPTNASPTAKFPEITIDEDATLVNPSTDEGAGIYAGGYAIWNIYGGVIGFTGIYAKSGDLTLNGATISATGDNYTPLTGMSNGYVSNGSAIIFDGAAGYAGNMEINISGNTTVTSKEGYALEERITSGNDHHMTDNAITISAGTFNGGSVGCIEVVEQTVKDKITNGGTITGGIYNEDITEYVKNPNVVITYVDTEDGQKWTIGNIPSGQTWKSDFNTENSYVQLNHTVATTTEVTGTKNIAYLAILGQDSVVVRANARLNVGEVVLGEDAVLIIEPTAMVVVTSTQGIISTSDDQLIIKASTDGYGQLLINPGVTFNTKPRATVEITTRSFRKSSTDYLYERFAIPTGLMVDEVSCTNSKEVRFAKYDDDQDKWVVLGYLNATGSHDELDPNDLNEPFVDYQFLVNTPNAGEKVTFKCQLVGNADAEMQLKGHWWNGFGNSYVAEMDVEELLAVLEDKFQGSSENIAIYVYSCTNPTLGIYEWKSITEMNMEEKLKLNPMEVFLIKNDGNGITMPISYKDLLWDPATEPAE